MHVVSNLYNEIRACNFSVDTALQIGRSDPVRICTDSELMANNRNANSELAGPVFKEGAIKTIKTTSKAFGGEQPTVGSCVIRRITANIKLPDFEIPKAARLVPYSRIVFKGKKSEWIPKGVFFIDTRKRGVNIDGTPTMEITGFDSMIKTEQLYSSSTLPNPASDISVVREIANAIGVEVDQRTVDALSNGFQISHSADYTYREVLGYVAALYGGNFVMSDTGALLFVPLGYDWGW